MQQRTKSTLAAFQLNVTQILVALRLNYALKYTLDLAPSSVRTWVEQYKPKQRWKLVPEKELQQTLREGLQFLAQKHGPDAIGDYLEFGVFQGTSLSCMYHALTELDLDQVRLFGFDSFEGLPEAAATDDGGCWEPGQYKSTYEYTEKVLTAEGIDWDRVALIKGWFSDTLTDDLIRKHKIRKASVIMVDCDIYSSAKEALDFCAALIQDEALILFDDWNSFDLAEKNLGEKRAFQEFLAKNPDLAAREFGQYSENSKLFLVTRKG